VFFSPLATNVVVCTKFTTKKEGRTTTCSYSPRRRRIRGGGQEEQKKKKRSDSMVGVDSSIAIDVGSRAFFQAS
jgi:hypothetical protein